MIDLDEKYVVVRADVLPDVILKVIEAKKLLAIGECKTSSEACASAGISRSAFYKYKDSALMYSDGFGTGIVTYYLTLCDRAGVFSEVLRCLYSHGANILTMNQNIPIDSAATATVTVRFDNGDYNAATICEEISQIDGVIRAGTSYGR
ncbi:MAG: ACT domain-containing protein [Oscillospiraceae bacterium]|nr:ACT domain-containing protein [Oscillospiraceae bacterium]